jgi:hypothetical protein
MRSWRRRSGAGAHQFQLAEQLHRGGHHQGADDGGVDDDREREPEAELLDSEDLAGGEPAKTTTMSSAAEVMTAGALQALGDGRVVVAGLGRGSP